MWYLGELIAAHTGEAKIGATAFHRHPFVIFFFEMSVTRIEGPCDVEKLAGLNADRPGGDDLGLGVAADRHIEVGTDDADLAIADRFDQDV